MIRAVCLGEAMVELRPTGPETLARAVAGDAYNTAVYLRRCLGADGEVAFLTAIGDDALSAGLMDDFERQGVDTRLAFVEPGRLPGLYLIELDASGDRSFHYWRSESAARRWMARLEAAGGADRLAGADLVFLSGVSIAILSPDDRDKALALLRTLKGRVGLIAFDPNLRPSLWRDATEARGALEPAIAHADIVLASRDDGAWLWGESDPKAQLRRYRALGCEETLVTLGEAGTLLEVDAAPFTLPSPARVVRDTSGAGDSFNGAYLAERLRGGSALAAARAGHALAARVVAHRGALIARELSHPTHTPSPPESS